ncbi:hypothetical protein E4T56_gene6102 [Termitomyces sp. T112]|nr:hypothetical protein E4T56_gene6102 [Termitomyces sp. T112]
MDTPNELLRSIQARNYVRGVSVSILVYDYVLCFSLEIQSIWPAAWTVPKVLYLIARFIPMSTIGVALYFQNRPSSDHACLQSEIFVIWSTYASMLAAESLFMIRAWAIWNLTITLWTNGTRSSQLPLNTDSFGCPFLIFSDTFSVATYGLILFFYTVTLFIILLRAYRHLCGRSTGPSQFVRLVHSQSIHSLTNRLDYQNILSQLRQVLSSVLACRMLFELRASSAGDGANTLEDSLSRIDFRQAIDPEELGPHTL